MSRGTGSRTVWDAVVVGAGVAGCVAAHALARRGFAVLLAERDRIPRFKVCGGCLNAGALAALEGVGLGDLPSLAAAPRLERLELAAGGRVRSLALPGGVAVRRSHLDGDLAAAAAAAGVELADGVRAELGSLANGRREVHLAGGTGRWTVEGRVILAASGLGGGFLASEPVLRAKVARSSRLGAGTVLEDDASPPQDGTVRMSLAHGGYVGEVAVDGGGLVVAAALAPGLVREAGGVGRAVMRILEAADRPVPRGLAFAAWKATPRLTRAVARAAAERVFLVGDAAGYVEPFTGEGMAWAIESALAAVPYADAAITRWEWGAAHQWTAEHRRRFAARHRRCRRLARALRHPRLVSAVLSVIDCAPAISTALVHRFVAAGVNP